jgi:hypothetical protein
MDLGFGGQEKSYIAKIPVRFFGKSAVSKLNYFSDITEDTIF